MTTIPDSFTITKNGWLVLYMESAYGVPMAPLTERVRLRLDRVISFGQFVVNDQVFINNSLESRERIVNQIVIDNQNTFIVTPQCLTALRAYFG